MASSHNALPALCMTLALGVRSTPSPGYVTFVDFRFDYAIFYIVAQQADVSNQLLPEGINRIAETTSCKDTVFKSGHMTPFVFNQFFTINTLLSRSMFNI